jgi:hypothetical protein
MFTCMQYTYALLELYMLYSEGYINREEWHTARTLLSHIHYK